MSIHRKSEETQLAEDFGEVSLREFDRLLRGKYGAVCGIDEAGRGPLAGDVYAAAVILDPNKPIDGINDSKKLSEKKREALFGEITEKAVSYGIGIATVEEIEQTDILSAALLAMKRAYEQLAVNAGIVLVDGDVLPEIGGLVKNLKHGDARSEAVAAASILAKVSRDRYMKKLGETYPVYGFEKHAGYGTKAHYAAIDEYGVCPAHRMSFLKKHFNNEQNR